MWTQPTRFHLKGPSSNIGRNLWTKLMCFPLAQEPVTVRSPIFSDERLPQYGLS